MFLPREVEEELAASRAKASKARPRLRVEAGTVRVPVREIWDDGFSVDREAAARLPGHVDFFDGDRFLRHCLIVATGEDAGRVHFAFKWRSDALGAPPLDYVTDRVTPAGFLPAPE
ncbi:hypothetical protein [Poseidonocella pacifica]|uniref:hypothetical protein n=1 Tax=Poseidonocella pacifica TaxID=871651 RepID=UPI000B8161CF|nr:hypothetical protein [Poseidonocella pacifica]